MLKDSLLVLLGNFLFLFLWKIFFTVFPAIGTWSFKEMLLLIAFSSGSLGLMQLLFGGVKRLPHLIRSQKLDTFIVHSNPSLLAILCSSSITRGWGHILTSLILFTTVKLSLFPLYLLCTLGSCLILTATHTLLYSLFFWFSLQKTLAVYEECLLLFSLYPTHIYGKSFRILLFSFLPVAYIGSFPVTLVYSFSWVNLLFFGSVVLLFCLTAFAIFSLGCMRYRKKLLLKTTMEEKT